MTKHFCDRCKEEIKSVGQGRDVKVFSDRALMNAHFICYPCAQILYDWLKGKTS